jgi:beta-lactam-binding protein with PASTA domain
MLACGVLLAAPGTGQGVPRGVTTPSPTLQQTPKMPSLLGHTVEYALQLLNRYGLELGPVDSLPSDSTPGAIILQSLAPGSPVKRGQTIGVTVAIRAPPDSVDVPRVLGQSPKDASAALLRADLSLGLVSSLPALDTARVVIRQYPQAGARVPRGTPVSLWYGYRQTVQVPSLNGSTIDAASRALEKFGLGLGPIDSVPTEGDTGRVVAQEPPVGTTVDSGTSVSITIGILRPVIVPRVVGSTLAKAEAELSQVGLRWGPIEKAETEGEADVVLIQKPEPGIAVGPGSSVALWVTASRPPVPVPDLVHRSLDSARSLVEARGLTLGSVLAVQREDGDSTIITQAPNAEAMVPAGTAIDVSIGISPVPIPVPDVVGLDRTEAERTLTAAGLRLSGVKPEESDRAPGTVVSQAPIGGTLVRRDAGVRVRLATASPLRVPDVVGARTAAAESTLGRMGIVSTRIDTAAGFGAHGVVLRQVPIGGSVVTPGLVVRLYVGAWSMAWLVGLTLAGAVGVGASASPAVRKLRDWRCRRRMKLESVSVAGTHRLTETTESLVQPDLQVHPKTQPGKHVLDVEGPLSPENLP